MPTITRNASARKPARCATVTNAPARIISRWKLLMKKKSRVCWLRVEHGVVISSPYRGRTLDELRSQAWMLMCVHNPAVKAGPLRAVGQPF